MIGPNSNKSIFPGLFDQNNQGKPVGQAAFAMLEKLFNTMQSFSQKFNLSAVALLNQNLIPKLGLSGKMPSIFAGKGK